MARSPDRRPGYSRRAQLALFLSYVAAVAGVALGAILLLLSTLDPPAFAALRMAASQVTTPVASVLSRIAGGVAGIPGAIGNWIGVHQENGRLRAGLASERQLVMRARVLARENRRLRALLRLRDGASDTVVVARIVSSTASSTRRFGLLNAGLWQGVREGQPVEAADGLVGRVTEVGPTTARVLLLIDPDSIVPVRRAGDGLPAIVSGRGDATLEVRAVNPALGEIRPGDLFVTSGTGGIFAADIPVAVVAARGGDGGLAHPLADPDTLDAALVRHAFLPQPPPARRTLP